jgi:ribosome maturation factor RimP
MSKPAELIKKEVRHLIEPIIDEMGFELVDIEYLSEYGRWILRIYVDDEGGINLDGCARVSNEIGDLIEMQDIVPHKYVLEVSSPGLNRPLVREKDFDRAVGKKVKVRMVAPVGERRNFAGYLKAFEEGTLYLEIESQLVSLPRRDVKKANLVYEFES